MSYYEGVVRLGSKVYQVGYGKVGIVIGYSSISGNPLVYFSGHRTGHSAQTECNLLSSPDGEVIENYYREGFIRGIWKGEVHYASEYYLKYLDQVFEGVEGYTEFFMQLLLDRSIEGV